MRCEGNCGLLTVPVKDGEEWTEEVTALCERCHNDKDETSEVQAERIQEQRRRGDSLVAWRRRKVKITVDRVRQARGEMMKNKANSPSDCLVTEMFRVRARNHWCVKRFRGDC